MDISSFLVSTSFALLGILVTILYSWNNNVTPHVKIFYTYRRKNKKILVFLWNAGRRALRKEDIVFPIFFEFNKNVILLKPRIIRQTNRRYHGKIAMIKSYSAKHFSIDFQFLNPKEGFVIEICYQSDIPKGTSLLCKSIIIDYSKIIKPKFIIFSSLKIEKLAEYLFFIILYIVPFSLAGIYFLLMGIIYIDNIAASSLSLFSSFLSFELIIVYYIFIFNRVIIPISLRNIESKCH